MLGCQHSNFIWGNTTLGNQLLNLAGNPGVLGCVRDKFMVSNVRTFRQGRRSLFENFGNSLKPFMQTVFYLPAYVVGDIQNFAVRAVILAQTDYPNAPV